jgi:hypothetical protein
MELIHAPNHLIKRLAPRITLSASDRVRLCREFQATLPALATTLHPVRDTRLVEILSRNSGYLKPVSYYGFKGLFLGGSFAMGLEGTNSDVDYIAFFDLMTEPDAIKLAKGILNGALIEAGYTPCVTARFFRVPSQFPEVLLSNGIIEALDCWSGLCVSGDPRELQSAFCRAFLNRPGNHLPSVGWYPRMILDELPGLYFDLIHASADYVARKFLRAPRINGSLPNEEYADLKAELSSQAEPFIKERIDRFPPPPDLIAALKSWE